MSQRLICSYHTEFFNVEKKNFEVFQCDLEREYLKDTCIFHSENSSLTIEKFTEQLNNKIKQYIENNKPILLIGYNFPFGLHLARPMDIYLPHVKPENHEPNIKLPIYLNKSTLHRRTEIINYHLLAIYFDDAVFHEVVIGGCLFNRSSFRNCIINNTFNIAMTRLLDVDFFSTTFKGYANFVGSMPYKSNFLGAKFCDEANFAKVTFKGPVSFNGVSFFKKCTFLDSRFEKQAIFNFANFYQAANFNGALFRNRTSFQYALLKLQEEVFFNSNLGSISFKDTDISRIRFGDDVTWNKDYKVVDELEVEWSVNPIFHLINDFVYDAENLKKFLIFIGLIDGDREYEFSVKKNKIEIIKIDHDREDHTIIGEIDLSNASLALLRVDDYNVHTFLKVNDNGRFDFYSDQINVESVISIYRNLRENYEFRLRYGEAGKFYIREMELNRVYKKQQYEKTFSTRVKKNNWLFRNLSLIGLYHLLSGYGESVSRPAMFALSIVIGSTILFSLLKDPFENVSLYSLTQLNISNIGSYFALDKAIERTWEDFIPLSPPNPNIHFGLIDLAIKAVGGLMTFTFIIVALRRRFERKNRH